MKNPGVVPSPAAYRDQEVLFADMLFADGCFKPWISGTVRN
jgi:hypothetical protein